MDASKEKLNAVFYNDVCVPRWYVGNSTELGCEKMTVCLPTLMYVCFSVTNLSVFMVATLEDNIYENECTFF